MQFKQPQVQQQFQAVPTFESLPAAVQQAPYYGNPLRKEAPVSQRPAPVFASQPAIPSYQGKYLISEFRLYCRCSQSIDILQDFSKITSSLIQL